MFDTQKVFAYLEKNEAIEETENEKFDAIVYWELDLILAVF